MCEGQHNHAFTQRPLVAKLTACDDIWGDNHVTKRPTFGSLRMMETILRMRRGLLLWMNQAKTLDLASPRASTSSSSLAFTSPTFSEPSFSSLFPQFGLNKYCIQFCDLTIHVWVFLENTQCFKHGISSYYRKFTQILHNPRRTAGDVKMSQMFSMQASDLGLTCIQMMQKIDTIDADIFLGEFEGDTLSQEDGHVFEPNAMICKHLTLPILEKKLV